MASIPPSNPIYDPNADPDDFDPSDPHDVWNQWANSWSDDEIDFLRSWLRTCYDSPSHLWNPAKRDARDQH